MTVLSVDHGNHDCRALGCPDTEPQPDFLDDYPTPGPQWEADVKLTQERDARKAAVTVVAQLVSGEYGGVEIDEESAEDGLREFLRLADGVTRYILTGETLPAGTVVDEVDA